MILLLSFLLFFQTSTQDQKSESAVKVMTFNIRLDISVDGENQWGKRTDLVSNLFATKKPDFIGMQEVVRNQLLDMEAFSTDYSWIGVGRDDGNKKGEYSPIFYNQIKFEMLQTNTFWLAKNPEIPSKDWDAAFNRVCTWGKFKRKSDGKLFYVFNTHFDHMGIKARVESAKLIRKKIIEITGNNPTIITGDFNTTPDSDVYKTMTQKNKNLTLVDTKSISKSKPTGIDFTFNGFDPNIKEKQTIDFIFVRKGTTVLSHETIGDRPNGRFISDHYPVMCEIVL